MTFSYGDLRHDSGWTQEGNLTKNYGRDAVSDHPNFRTFEEDHDRLRDYGLTTNKSEGKFFGRGPKGWTRSSERIKDEASEALYRSPFVDATDIEVSVEDGVVVLSGWVEDREMKKEAERCVEEVVGIKDVRNEIHLRNRKF